MNRKLSYVLMLALLVVLSLGGCANPPVSVVGAGGGRVDASTLGPEVDPATVAALAGDGAVTVIDVREDWEYEEGHIEGAVLIPLGSLPERVDDIPTDRPVILVCRSANRSGQAYRFLTQEGFTNVHNMVGGMIAWEEAGLEIAR